MTRSTHVNNGIGVNMDFDYRRLSAELEKMRQHLIDNPPKHIPTAIRIENGIVHITGNMCMQMSEETFNQIISNPDLIKA